MNEQLEKIGKTNKLKNLKIKSNEIILDFDFFKLKIFPDIESKYNFKIGETYSDEYIKKCISDNNKTIVNQYALNKLNNKFYCESDIKVKLCKKFKNLPSSFLNEIVKTLKSKGVIDDKKYVEEYLSYFNSGGYGKYYIINFFKNKKISSKIINSLKFDDKLEKEKAINYFELIKNKFVSKNFIKQKKKLYENLLRRGFDISLIYDIVSSIKIDETKEEYQITKAYLKLKNKFNNEKIDESQKKNKIISKLIAKGYAYEKILEIIKKDEEGSLKND